MRLFLGLLLAWGGISMGQAAEAVLPRLPDGEITRAADVTAYLTYPTDKYKHAILGDAIEAEGFAVERAGKRLEFRLGADTVFEDRRVRLIDVDGDGIAEAIVVKSTLEKGASLAIFKLGKTRIDLLAETMPIGVPNRWLNPVGVVEMAHDGRKFVAAVITPHLTGSLRFYELRGKNLVEVSRVEGVTNHINGSRNLDLAVVQDVDGDGAEDVILPTLDRKALVLVSLRDGKAAIVQKVPVNGRIIEVAMQSKGKFQVLLDSGEKTVVALPQPPLKPDVK